MTRAQHFKEASRPTEQQLHTAVVRNTTEFASLKQEWDHLHEKCPSATPFQSWEWLYSWWEVYGEGSYGLRLITLRDENGGGGLLVGLLPLMVRHGRLLLLGGDKITLYSDVMTPYKDVLVREAWEEPVAEVGAQALKELDGWRVADLQELMPQAVAWDIFREWDGPKTSLPITDYLLMRAVPWEELLSSLSRKLRKTARRTLRHAEQDGVRCEPADFEDAERAARTLVDLHRQLWQGRRIAPEHLTPRYEAFMQAAARRMSARGTGRISEFRRQDGKVLVSQFLVFDKDFVGAYVTGASEEASRRYQFETLSNWDALNVAQLKSSGYVSFMDGVTQDKLRWASEVVTSQRAILGRGKAFWIPYAGYHLLRNRYYTLRSEAQRYLHSDDAPRWVKSATNGYYALLSYPHAEDAPRWIKNATRRYYAIRGKYGYGWLRYRLELARARRETESNTNSKATVNDSHTRNRQHQQKRPSRTPGTSENLKKAPEEVSDTLARFDRASGMRGRMQLDRGDPIPNEVKEVLAQGLQDHFGRPVRILELHSSLLATSSTHLLSRLHLTLDSGRQFTVILKRLQPQLDRDVRQTVLIYRRLLADRRLDAPMVYASICDEARRRYWLFLEDVGEWKLHYCEVDAWLAAFRWLARMHATYYDRDEELRALGLLREHSPVFYRFLARSAGEVLQKYAEQGQIARFKRAMTRWFDVSVAHLARQPRTLVHGDSYDKNFMVEPDLRIRPIDWEYAAIGVAASDMAQLVAGWGPEKPHFITVYLDEFAQHATVPVDRRAFERTLIHCEFMSVLQVLYWWEGPYENLAVVDGLLDELESACYQLESEGKVS